MEGAIRNLVAKKSPELHERRVSRTNGSTCPKPFAAKKTAEGLQVAVGVRPIRAEAVGQKKKTRHRPVRRG